MRDTISGQLQSHFDDRQMTSGAGTSVMMAALAAASAVAIVLGPIAVAIIALVSAGVMPLLVMTSVLRAIRRHTLGDIDPHSLTAARRLAISSQTRLDPVSRAMAASAGIELVAGHGDLTIHGLCGSIVDSTKGRTIVRGGIPQLVRAIVLSRRAMSILRIGMVLHLAVALVASIAAIAGWAAILPGSLLLVSIAGIQVIVRDLESGRHLSAARMTRMQRRIQRRFETMFRGI